MKTLSDILIPHWLIFWVASHIGSHHFMAVTSADDKATFLLCSYFFLYVVVEFVELTWHIRHDPICKNMWNFFFNSIFCHEVDDILKMVQGISIEDFPNYKCYFITFDHRGPLLPAKKLVIFLPKSFFVS